MKKVILIISSLVLFTALLISIPYIKFIRLDVYDYDVRTGTIKKDGIEYIPAKTMPSSITSETEKTIGRCKSDKFLGFKTWIIKLKGVDEKEEFFVRGLMYEALYIRKEKNDVDNTNVDTFDEIKAVAMVIKNNPDFPSNPKDTITKKLSIGGKQNSTIDVKFATKVQKVGEDTYQVTLLKDWGITVNNKYVKSSWKYEVTPKYVLLLESEDNENLPNIIK